MSGVRHVLLLVGLAAILVLPSATAQAQSAKSEELVKQLTQLMGEKELQFVAAQHPTEQDRFVAAMLLPGIQLVAISARYEQPTLLTASLTNKKYQDVYLDLNAAALSGSRIFVEDVGANGLLARPEDNQPFDVLEKGQERVEFAGDWKKMKIDESAYMVLFSEAEAHYSAVLTQLIAALKK